MKTSKRRRMPMSLSSARSARVEQPEIKIFLSALGSYPDRFAREPHVSFEQHFFRIAATNRLVNGSRRRRA
ncbi:MAG TPA: hypothetical protein VGZ28_13025 [Terriglobales bacterium]|jgi:hypothetical protein|nr:hypothetical protein [Terriglobales bacterium]